MSPVLDPASVSPARQRDFAECRAGNRHRWDDDVPAFTPSNPTWKFKRQSVCERCGTVRKLAIDAYGEVVHRSYTYPPGYSYAVDDTPTVAEFRLYLYGEVAAENPAPEDP